MGEKLYWHEVKVKCKGSKDIAPYLIALGEVKRVMKEIKDLRVYSNLTDTFWYMRIKMRRSGGGGFGRGGGGGGGIGGR